MSLHEGATLQNKENTCLEQQTAGFLLQSEGFAVQKPPANIPEIS